MSLYNFKKIMVVPPAKVSRPPFATVATMGIYQNICQHNLETGLSAYTKTLTCC